MTEYKEYEELLEKVDELVKGEANYQDKVSALGEIACHCLKALANEYNTNPEAKGEADMFLWDAMSILYERTDVASKFMSEVYSDTEDRYSLMFGRN